MRAAEAETVRVVPLARRPLLRFGTVMTMGLAVAGCSNPAVPISGAQHGHVMVAPGTTLSLPSPATLQRPVEAQQLIVAHYAGRTFAFQTVISVTPSRVLVVGTDMMGRRALTIPWPGAAMTIEAAAWVPSEMRPANMIADIMLLHWPLAVLRTRLTPPAAELLVPHPRQRVVMLDGRPMIRAYHVAGAPGSWSGRWTYRNLGWGYKLDIQSVELAP